MSNTDNKINKSRAKDSFYKYKNFKIIPLGGMKEIGKNCTLIECDQEIVIIDCGFSFPDDELFGIDVVIPDFTYLKENAAKIKGLVITHGHEDHIGGIPYLLQEFDIPVYASPLAMGLIKHKLQESNLKVKENIINYDKKFKVGQFEFEPIRINHSIADSMAFAIRFGGNLVVHTGDFKIDYSPIDGKVIDLNKFSALGSSGVDVLISDSTNVLKPGYTPSEQTVAESINKIFDSTDKRIIIATFSSNIYRIKYFMEASVKHGRRIAVSGRSLENVMELAKELGYLNHLPESAFVDIREIKNIPDKNLTIITTGSQGEPMSALTRMASDEHKTVKLKKGDVVVFSSTPIPGNEKTVTNVINLLYEKGVEVIVSDSMNVHVSGHACKEELKLMHTLIRARYFIPAHGEYRHLVEHSKLCSSLGTPAKNIFILSNGDCLNVSNKLAEHIKSYTSGEDINVDGLGIGDVGGTVLNDRKQLSQSGLIVIGVAIDKASKTLVAAPEITTRGFVYVKENKQIIDEAISVVYNTIGDAFENGEISHDALYKALRNDMRSYIYKRTKRSPVILPMILYV